MPQPLSPDLQRRLVAMVAEAQRRWRTPGLSVGVVQDGDLVWSTHLGSARLDPPTPATDDTQVKVGSITKTFTALLVMQLRDEGRLTLDDELRTWLPETRHSTVTVRQLLSHSSGLQREPVGHIWEALVAPDVEQLVADLEDAERLLPPHFVFHYSNLGFALLGLLVERLDGRGWEDGLRARLLDPLGMNRTSLRPQDDHAVGYQVHPFAGTTTQEPDLDLRATAPIGGLWSSVADMARYAAFLTDPDPDLLRPATLEEMCRPLVMTDPDGWTSGYGLGFELVRSDERVYVGHRGSMPGFLTGLRVRRPDRAGAFVAATSTAGAEPGPLAVRLLDLMLAETSRSVAPWTPERRHPELDELLGSWWSEGEELVLEVREGQLWMRVPGGTHLDESRFVRESDSVFQVVEGRERGERLELVRDADGSLAKLYLATYPVTRSPTAFADLT